MTALSSRFFIEPSCFTTLRSKHFFNREVTAIFRKSHYPIPIVHNAMSNTNGGFAESQCRIQRLVRNAVIGLVAARRGLCFPGTSIHLAGLILSLLANPVGSVAILLTVLISRKSSCLCLLTDIFANLSHFSFDSVHALLYITLDSWSESA